MFQKKRSIGVALVGWLATVAVIAAVVPAEAANEPENVIKYRISVMKAIGGHIGAISGVVKGEVTYSQHVASHARAMHSTSMMLLDIFPEGSGVGETRAKAEIWQDWDKFSAAAKALQTASGELARVAEGGDLAAIGAQLGEVGKSCGGCHKPFRKEKQ